jgi:hypothetical protein
MDELRLDANDAIARAAQPQISPRIGAAPKHVIAAIHLDDEPRHRREKINDEPDEHRLPAKRHAKLASAKRLPKPSLRRRRPLP